VESFFEIIAMEFAQALEVVNAGCGG